MSPEEEEFLMIMSGLRKQCIAMVMIIQKEENYAYL